MAKDKRADLPPLKDKTKKALLDVIDRMETKQTVFAKQPFKPSELLQMFVRAEHRDVLTEAYQLCEPSGVSTNLWVPRIAPTEYGAPMCFMHFHWGGRSVQNAFYVPHAEGSAREYPASMQPDAPVWLQEKYNMVADDLIGIAYRFAQVRRVLHRLNDPRRCKSVAAMRYHWPCLVPLLRAAGYRVEAEQIAEPNSRAGDGAKLETHLRHQLAPSNQTVASHFLIDDNPVSSDKLPIQYSLDHNFKNN